MTSAYPGALDALPNPTSATLMNASGFEHDVLHTAVNDAVEAVQAELGTDPSGSFATVKARLAGLTPTIATSAPSSPVTGQVWYDSTTTPYVGKVWNGSAWTIFSQTGSGGAALVWATVTGGTVTTVTNPDGSTDEVHTFLTTAAGPLVVTAAGYAEVFAISGGAGGSGAAAGDAGDVLTGMYPLPAGALTVVVGAGGTTGASAATFHGRPSSLGTLATAAVGASYMGAGATNGDTGYALPFTSSITGTAVQYGAAGVATPVANRGQASSSASGNGSSGVVIVRVKVTPAPQLPAATGWAQVTGGTVTEYTKPDGSVMEVHTFTAATGTLTVVAAGYADCLIVGGGWGNAGPNGGRMRDGMFALPAGALPVVAAQSSGSWQSTVSMLGDLTSGAPTAGVSGYNGGPGATNVAGFSDGRASSITGTSVVYCHSSGTTPGSFGRAGIVIVAVQKTPPTASGVVASGGTETTFTGDGTNGVLGQGYKVHTFTASGSLVVSAAPAGSVCEVFMISGGAGRIDMGGAWADGAGGDVIDMPLAVSVGTIAVVVGAGGVSGTTLAGSMGKQSKFGSKVTSVAAFGALGSGATDAAYNAQYSTLISGTAVTYGAGGSSSPRANRGDGGPFNATTPGSTGVVIVRYKV